MKSIIINGLNKSTYVPNADFVGYAVKTALREVTGEVRCW